MKKLLFLIFLVSGFSFANNWLWVQNPNNWYGGYGSIDEAFISIKPQGLYMEYGLYLTFSAKDQGFTNSDTLEVQFYFDLPANSVVVDSWLWIDSTIIRAKIMDQWTASSIYEDIVNRRRDPSILFKRSDTQYELRIFPMAGDKTRKVKITYLVPNQWNATSVTASIPTNLLQCSNKPLNKFEIATWLDQDWKNPKILEFPDITFRSKSDADFGNYFKADLPTESIQYNLNFSLDSPLHNGIYVNKFQDGEEGIYQMAFLPSKVLNISVNHKTAILIDYDASMSTVTKRELLNNLKSNLLSNFTSKDSFNLIFSKANIFRLSENWMTADSASVENIFDNLGENQISDYSNLPSLLANGIDFVKNHGNDGTILLLAISDQNGDFKSANQLIEDLLSLMDPVLPINILNFQNQNYSYHWFGGRFYYGNEYFYENISRMTTANYYSILNSNISISQIISNAFQSLSGFISSFDLHTKLDDGYCYGRYNLDLQTSSVYLNKPILQVGKFRGNFPFIIETSGVYKDSPFSETYSLNETQLLNADSVSKAVWVGNYIRSLENQNQSNDVVNAIVGCSLTERILSLYSAFICLEPNRGGDVCYNCMDESSLSAVKDSTKNSNDSLSLTAYPNPFNSQVNLVVKLPDNYNPETVSFRLYNILGQLIKTFHPGFIKGRKEFKVMWDGKNDNGNNVSSGNYFFVVTTPEKVRSMKLILLK